MVRRPQISTRIAILCLFLRNGNQALNVSRISTKVVKLRAQSIKPNRITSLSVSHRQVRKICEDLKEKGFLDTVMAKPPRYKEKTIHYRLPETRQDDMLRAVGLLLRTSPIELLQSEYLSRVLEGIAVHVTRTAFDADLNHHQIAQITQCLAVSPEALSRFLDPELNMKLHRIAGVCQDGVPTVDTLLEYIAAANLLDVADANWSP